jgi:hypothetical protein
MANQSKVGEPELPPSVVKSCPKTQARVSPSSEPSGRWTVTCSEPFHPVAIANSVLLAQVQSTPSWTQPVNAGAPGNPTTQNDAKFPRGPSGSANTGITAGTWTCSGSIGSILSTAASNRVRPGPSMPETVASTILNRFLRVRPDPPAKSMKTPSRIRKPLWVRTMVCDNRRQIASRRAGWLIRVPLPGVHYPPEPKKRREVGFAGSIRPTDPTFSRMASCVAVSVPAQSPASG